jgi:hypothetical protein
MSDECQCEKCGTVLSVGDYPFCPHPRGSQTVVGDDIPGGQIFENGFATPQKFYSHSEHRAALAALGREPAPKWVPGDKHLTRWDTVDLEAAAVLVTRGAQARAEKRALLDEFPITVTDVTFAKDA